MNKRLAYITNFGLCSPDCQKGEPIGLTDGRILQANRCMNGNVCVIAGKTALTGEGTLSETDKGEHVSAIYTAEELYDLRDGKPVLAVGGIFRKIVETPALFHEGEIKPEAASDEFYEQYFDTPFSSQ